jgi:hypothetical protein
MSGFLDDANAWFEDLTKPGGPYRIPQQPTASGTSVIATRRNPQTGSTQIQRPDPDPPGYRIWVDAIWNPATDWMVPIDPRYRYPGETFPVDWSGGRLRFADDGGIDFSGPLNLGLPGAAAPLPGNEMQVSFLPGQSVGQSSGGSGSTVLLVAGGLLILYFLSR